MRLSKKDAKKIADYYRLGKIKKVKPFSGGWVNYNFLLETSLGKFVVQVLGDRKDYRWKLERMKIQFKVLDFLNKRKFPYDIPSPVKNRKESYIMDFKGRKLWVYDYIEGDHIKGLNKEQFKEFARAIALYHKFIIPLGDLNDKEYTFEWILNRYSILKKKKPRNKLDKLFVENADFFHDILKKLKKIDYGKMIICHSDFNDGNILIKKRKIYGIVDFDNLKAAPRASDIGIALKRIHYPIKKGWTKKKEELFLKEYEKITKLSKRDKELIIPTILKESCSEFCWFYKGLQKHRDQAYKAMLEILKETKELEKRVNWKKLLKK